MNNAIFTYLKSYSTDPFKVDRLIISAILYSLDLQNTGNQFLQQYIIQKEDDDNQNLKEFLSIHLFTEIEELIRVFEFVISPEDKILTGAIYTPKNIRDYIFEQCFCFLLFDNGIVPKSVPFLA